MRLTVVQPDIHPQFSSYQTDINGNVTINVGFTPLPSLNSVITYSNRNYTLKDANGNLVEEGVLSVKLNSFDTTITFSGLTPNSFFIFTIYNPISGDNFNSTIVTGNIIGVIDNTVEINPSVTTVTSNLIIINNHIYFNSKVTFNTIGSALNNGSFLGNSLVMTNGTLYAYKPTVIYTSNRSIKATINYTPFIGLSTYIVPVYQIMKITKVGKLRYSIEPPSTFTVTTDSQSSNGLPPYVQSSPVGFIDLTMVGLTSKVGDIINFTQIFPS
jgi:hypothetical protein